ncbi:MAG: rane-fusion protein [Bacteroidetes bacterium]|nr:rane-fusion protein [Bacteroidota bacterium]
MGALIEINTDGLAKLGETICNAFGWSAKGYRKMADARIYERIENAKADTAIEIEKLHGHEIVEKYNEIRNIQKVENVANIIAKAEQQFNEGEQVSNEPVDKDWLNRFFDCAEGVSEEEMQNIWAKILAGEVKQPKSFSLRTLDVLKNMTKEEAELFVEIAPKVYNYERIFKAKNENNLDRILKLNDIGLVLLESIYNNFEIEPQKFVLLKLDGTKAISIVNETPMIIKLNIPCYKLSTAGKELFKMLETEISEDTLNNIVAIIKSQGISQVLLNSYSCDQTGMINFIPIKVL